MRTAAQRRHDRAAGIDRYGNPLARSLGSNPRALAASHDARAPQGGGHGRVARKFLNEFVRQERITCFRCQRHQVEWAAGGWREPTEPEGNPCWVICIPCVRQYKELQKRAA
jgi:hypothetical protein